jgi:hypothetical protein
MGLPSRSLVLSFLAPSKERVSVMESTGRPTGLFLEERGVERAGGEVGHGLVQMRVIDEAQRQIRPLRLAVLRHERHRSDGCVDLLRQRGNGTFLGEDSARNPARRSAVCRSASSAWSHRESREHLEP